jgi:UDP-glucose 4-epimerase
VRLFNTVGPRQSPAYGMVIPRLVNQALAGEPLTVYGDGTQTRCFAHVADVVDALVRLLDTDDSIGETFNIGSPHEISIRRLADRIIEYTASDSEVRLVPYEAAYGPGFEDMSRRVPDTRKLQALTGWRPTRTLDDAILDTIAAARASATTSGLVTS